MDMQAITLDMVVNKYGTHSDGIFVWNGTKKVGFVTDLRTHMARKEAARKKQKEYTNRVNEQRAEALPEAVDEMIDFLDNHLAKYGAEVFKNITQPNVHANGCKCYVIVDPIYCKHRLGIMHRELNYSEMAEYVEACFKCSPSESSDRHILISGLSRDDIVEVILKLCSK